MAQGYVIVSGGASGVDTLAHTITLREGGRTIAVMGTGLDIAYPRDNISLFERIVESGGALVSQFPLGTEPGPYNFPVRNEVIAGLSRGVIIPEAGEKSGTLITARLALENNRDVFAVPGDIYRPTSDGTNTLIRDGLAKPILAVEDILAEYQPVVTAPATPTPALPTFDDPSEAQVYGVLTSVGACDISQICDATDLDVPEVIRILSDMEIRGVVRRDLYGSYSI